MQADFIFGAHFLSKYVQNIIDDTSSCSSFSAEPGNVNLSGTNLSLEQLISFIQAEDEYLADNSR